MDHMPQENVQPASHYEYVLDHQEAARVKHQAFAYMKQLHGWCAEEKAGVLVDMVLKYKPETILEIGVYGGKSVVPMAYALKVNQKGIIYGIDPWDSNESVAGLLNPDNRHFWQWLDHLSIMNYLIQKIEDFDLNDQIVLIKSTSEAAAPIYNIDILHIDGNHSDATSYIDVTKWVPFVKSGGFIIFDDMTWTENNVNSTARAVNWLNEHCIKFAEFSDTCVWGIWYKP